METNESRHRFEQTAHHAASLYNMLYVRGNNGDTDDAEYYVNHLAFAVLPELDGDILYTVLSFKAAPRWLRHDGMRG